MDSMSGQAKRTNMTWRPGKSVLRLALASTWLAFAHAAAAEQASAVAPKKEDPTVEGPAPEGPTVTVPRAEMPRRHARRGATTHGIEERVRLLARGLDLDAKQQAELRRLLESQRDQIKRVWADGSIPAEDHVGATRAILETTRERIRAMLNDEQRKKYPAARSPRDPSPGQPDVEQWMRLTQPKPGQGTESPH
jgi:hypothetical protein